MSQQPPDDMPRERQRAAPSSEALPRLQAGYYGRALLGYRTLYRPPPHIRLEPQRPLAPIPADQEDAPPDNLNDLLRPRRTPRQRIWNLLGVAVIIFMALGILHRLIAYQVAQSSAVTDVPAIAPPPLHGPVVIVSNTSYGSASVNGHALAGPPPFVFTPIQGDNAITLTAPPFAPHTCHMAWPEQHIIGDCQAGHAGSLYAIQGKAVLALFTLYFPLRAADMPPDLQASANDAASRAINGVQLTTMVPAGQYYATGYDGQGQITASIASAPLVADLLFSPASAAAGDCVAGSLCPAGLDINTDLSSTARIWSVFMPVSLRWRFTSGVDSQVYSGVLATPEPAQFFLTYSDTTGWSIPQPPIPLAFGQTLADELQWRVCDEGQSMLQPLAQRLNGGIAVPHDAGLAGCALQLLTHEGGKMGLFVWRFGVLLAADTAAHTIAPALPLAPAAEVAAVNG